MLFISHKSDDRKAYPQLWRQLDKRGVAYWNPKALQTGRSLREGLHDGMESCDACIFVATRQSMKADWCQAELGAFWGVGKPVITFIADTALGQDALPSYLQDLVSTRHASKAVSAACQAAERWRRGLVAGTFEAFATDDEALPRIEQLLAANRDRLKEVRLIQHSGAYALRLLTLLNRWNGERPSGNKIRTRLLLIHPTQVLRGPNFPVTALQLEKLRVFLNTRKADLNPRPQIRYYLHPASLRGLAVPNVLCAVGWYTHEGHWLRGHSNATIVTHGNDVVKTATWQMFNRLFKVIWDAAIPAQQDELNVKRLLTLNGLDTARKVTVPGIVVRGHGVASGASRRGRGTLAKQAKLLGRYINWRKFWKGTINVSISPRMFAWRNKKATITRARWSASQPPEDFALATCRIEVDGQSHKAWVYHPHPRTKSQNLQNASVVEIIAPRLENIRYGATVNISLDASKFAIW